MDEGRFKLSRNRIIWVAAAIILILVSWLGAAGNTRGLNVDIFQEETIPMRFIRPEEGENLPGVIIAHGFGGSQQIMLGYAYAIANAGYGVMLFDFAGHAANPNPIDFSENSLQDNLDVVYQALIAKPEVDAEKVALLGHSMGSGAVMQAGIDHPERFSAVIAISPTAANVNIVRPPNLLLQAGSLEGTFVENAQELLIEAGGPNENFADRRARRFDEIPNVEHITILISSGSRESAIDWLNLTFELENPGSYSDTRMLWFGLHLTAWLVLAAAISPLIGMKTVEFPSPHPEWRKWLGLILAPFLATGVIALVNPVVDLTGLLGLQVGGALAIWFVIMGAVWLAAGYQLISLSKQNLLWGLAFFAILWLALGLMAQYTWMSWFLIPARLWRWPILALACLPWKLAVGNSVQSASGWMRAGLWTVQSAVFVAALFMMGMVVPGMFVVVLIAPILPLILGIEFIVGKHFDNPWAYAIGSALLIGWMVVSFFPII